MRRTVIDVTVHSTFTIAPTGRGQGCRLWRRDWLKCGVPTSSRNSRNIPIQCISFSLSGLSSLSPIGSASFPLCSPQVLRLLLSLLRQHVRGRSADERVERVLAEGKVRVHVPVCMCQPKHP